MLLPLQKRQVLLWKSLSPMGSVQPSRWDVAIFLMIPGTSCLATIVLSLRDENHSRIEAPRNYLNSYVVETPWSVLAEPFRVKIVSGSKGIQRCVSHSGLPLTAFDFSKNGLYRMGEPSQTSKAGSILRLLNSE